jgi:cytochrome c-type biogenesis protein CcmH/NrfG
MSPLPEPLSEFERNARTVLEESVQRIDGRTRSRLNQARQAAVAAAAKRAPWWRGFTLMPAGAVTAALLVAVVLWQRHPAGELPVLDGPHISAGRAAVDDIDLLADGDAMELIEGWDGSFYEWAAAQNDASGESNG